MKIVVIKKAIRGNSEESGGGNSGAPEQPGPTINCVWFLDAT